MPYNFTVTDNARELRRVWKGKHQLPAGEIQNTYTPVESKPGGSFVGAIFKKTPTKPGKPQEAGKKWLGKLGFAMRGFESSSTSIQTRSLVRRGLDAVAEKVAGDAYHLANRGLYHVPKHRLAVVPVLHDHLREGDRLLAEALLSQVNQGRAEPITQAIHIFSKWIEGYQDLSLLQTRYQGHTIPFMDCLTRHRFVPETIWVDNQEIPLVGLMDILAVARLLGDTDVLGGGGSNAGVVVHRNPSGEPVVAVAVKIDPGFAFNFRGIENKFHQTRAAISLGDDITEHMLQDLKDIQFGNSQDIVIQWTRLSDTQRQDFILALDHAKSTFEEGTMIEVLLLRAGAFCHQGKDLINEATARTIAKEWRQNLKLQIDTYAPARPTPEHLETIRRERAQRTQAWTQALRESAQPNPPVRTVNVTMGASPKCASTPPQNASRRTSNLVASSAAAAASTEPPRPAPRPQSTRARQGSAVQAAEPVQAAAAAAAVDTVQGHPSLRGNGRGFFPPATMQSNHANVPVDQAKVNQLLLHVARGEQDQAERLLQTNPELLWHKGKVTDYSNRTFNSITAFQYALWALDWHMWKMLLKYLPEKEAALQLQALEDHSTEHGLHYDFSPLIQALKTYVDQYDALSKENKWLELQALWIKGVGGAQAQVPAHVANEYCRPDRSFDPKPSFREDTLPRTFDIHKNNKFFPLAKYSWGSLSYEFALYRTNPIYNQAVGVSDSQSAWGMASSSMRLPDSDWLAISHLSEVRAAQYQALRERLTLTTQPPKLH